MADTEQASPSTEDAEIGLKKRARRRLVGATALALLAVIVLPLVMDKEPKPAGNDIQIRIPSQDAGNFTSRILPAQPAATPLPPVEAAAPTAPVVAPTAPAAVADPAALPAPKVETSPNAPKSSTSPTAPPAVDKSAGKGPSGDQQSPSAAVKDVRWVVQLGAYHDTANIKALRSKVKELGYATYTEEIDTSHGARTRVRAGPFSSREAALKAQQRLKKIGAGGPAGGVVVQQ